MQGTKRNTDSQLSIHGDQTVNRRAVWLYIYLLKLVTQSPYWRSASVLMPLSQLSEECRLGVRQLQRYLAELRQAGWLETRFNGPQGNEYFLKQF